MPVPSSIADLSTTATSNGPAGGDVPSTLDDYIRATQAIVKQNVTKGADIASGSTITIPASGSYFVVTGTATISAISDTNTWDGREVTLRFSGALTLTHSASLVLPGAANITTATGDVAKFVRDAPGTWRCTASSWKVNYATEAASAAEADTLAPQGSAGQVYKSTGASTALEFGSALNYATSVTATGAAVDFTGIPSWAKRITVMLSGVSGSGTSPQILKLGNAGGVETTGYSGASGLIQNGATSQTAAYSSGFNLCGLSAITTASILNVVVTLTCLTENTWIAEVVGAYTNTAVPIYGGGTKTLSDTLTQVRITHANGSDTFDSGTISVSWE